MASQGQALRLIEKSTASLQALKPHSRELAQWILVRIGELAALLGEPMDAAGVRQSLIAQELSDLPAESLAYALDCWKKGDKRHLSAYQQDVARIGVFFPKPAELREIAELHAAEKRKRDREEAKRLEDEAYARDLREHPENYCSMADVAGDLYVKKGAKGTALNKPQSTICTHCNGKLSLQGLSPADLRVLADALERQASHAES
jgi:hypothetical protein